MSRKVYDTIVLDCDGNYLSRMKAKRAIIKVTNQEAKVVCENPLTIQLQYEVKCDNDDE